MRAADNPVADALDGLTAYKDADDGLDHGTAHEEVGALANRNAVTVASGAGERAWLTDDAA